MQVRGCVVVERQLLVLIDTNLLLAASRGLELRRGIDQGQLVRVLYQSAISLHVPTGRDQGLILETAAVVAGGGPAALRVVIE